MINHSVNTRLTAFRGTSRELTAVNIRSAESGHLRTPSGAITVKYSHAAPQQVGFEPSCGIRIRIALAGRSNLTALKLRPPLAGRHSVATMRRSRTGNGNEIRPSCYFRNSLSLT